MLNILRFIFGLLFVLYLIGILLFNFGSFWMFILLGAYLLVTGIQNLKMGNKKMGYLDITLGIAAFILLML